VDLGEHPRELSGDRTGHRASHLQDRRVEAEPRLDAHREHVEGVGESTLKLLLSLESGVVKQQVRKEEAGRTCRSGNEQAREIEARQDQ
jgi:hypothetical protein